VLDGIEATRRLIRAQPRPWSWSSPPSGSIPTSTKPCAPAPAASCRSSTSATAPRPW